MLRKIITIISDIYLYKRITLTKLGTSGLKLFYFGYSKKKKKKKELLNIH